MISLYDYFDFKEYLKDFRNDKKKSDPGFTNQYICYRLGQKKSKSYFNNVVQGRVKLSPEFINRFLELLELNEFEGVYFRNLVFYCQSTVGSEKKYYLEQLLMNNKVSKKIIDTRAYQYFKEWYNPALREILNVVEFSGDHKELGELLEPKVTSSKVRKSIQLMLDLGLIIETSKGVYCSTQKNISTGNTSNDAIIDQYHLDAIERAKAKVIQSSLGRQTTVSTAALSVESMQIILKSLSDVQSKILSLSENDQSSGQKVYEFLFHIHSLSKELNQ